MKKIAFSDRYGLTRAVVDYIKTNTRRAEKSLDVLPLDYNPLLTEFQFEYKDGIIIGRRLFKGSHVETYHLKPRYKIGEVVAVAQRYSQIITFNPSALSKERLNYYGVGVEDCKYLRGWNNKMFVRADLMPHRIRITDIKVERLKDISDEDCMREGIMEGEFMNTWDKFYFDQWGDVPNHITFKTPRETFAALIDRISGKGTWERNHWVYAYSFELVKEEEQ